MTKKTNEKRCGECLQLKPLTEFYKYGVRIAKKCKVCDRKAVNERYYKRKILSKKDQDDKDYAELFY